MTWTPTSPTTSAMPGSRHPEAIPDKLQTEDTMEELQKVPLVLGQGHIVTYSIDQSWILFFGVKLCCGRGIHGAGSLRSPSECRVEEVLRHHNSPNPCRKVDDKVEAHLIALACSQAPEGHDHWTLRLLAGKVVELGLVESLSHETVRLHQKKHPLAVAQAAVVHSQSRRRVRGGHGGCAGPLSPTPNQSNWPGGWQPPAVKPLPRDG